MGGKRESDYEWRRKRGRVNKTLARLADLPINAVGGGRPLTESAKRKLWEEGIPGRAVILKAPGKSWVSDVRESEGKFTARVELPNREPYEVGIWQSFTRWEWDALQQGALVECRVDPEKQERVLLCPPEGDEVPLKVIDSAQIIAEGKRARATVTQSAGMEQTAPGTDDRFFLLNLELRADGEAEPWKVQIGQRVPNGAEQLVEAGNELDVAYLQVDSGDSVAVDWPATTGGRFS